MSTLPSNEASLWRESYTNTHYPQLEKDIEVDVVIVGAGITGLTSAYLLKKEGKTVALLDKDTVGGGTTGRTTGKITAQHNLIYEQLVRKHGEVAARAYGEANSAAIELIAGIVGDEKLDCDFRREDNYVFTTDLSQRQAFEKEASTAKRLGLPAELVEKTPLPFDIVAAVTFKHQATFDAQKYVLGLARAVHGEGSYVFEHSNVIGIKDGTPAKVRTSRGVVTARDIIVATNVPTLPLLARGGYCVLEYPNESYLIAGELPKKFTGMYISPDTQHFSLLPFTYGGKRMLLIGGGGHLSGVRLSKKAKYQKLAEYAETQFGIKTITHKWSDRDYLSYDMVPVIGKLYSWSKHVYVATAFQKWGMTNGTVAAMILTDTIVGRNNQWAFAFDSMRRGSQFASMPAAVVKEAKKLVT